MENSEAEATADWIRQTEIAVGRKVRDLRRQRGWSQERLAHRMRLHGFAMHQTTVAKLEAGDRPIRLAEAVALAAAFDVPFEALWFAPTRSEGEPLDIAAARLHLQNLDRLIQDALGQVHEAVKIVATYEAERTWLACNLASGMKPEAAAEDAKRRVSATDRGSKKEAQQ